MGARPHADPMIAFACFLFGVCMWKEVTNIPDGSAACESICSGFTFEQSVGLIFLKMLHSMCTHWVRWNRS